MVTQSKNIKHDFDLKGLQIGDSFLGCNECWFQYDPKTVAKRFCPKCRNPYMSILTVTEDDKDKL